MTLQRLFLTYLAVLHIALGGVLLWYFGNKNYAVLWTELALILSLLCGTWLLMRFFQPLKMLLSSVDFLKESDFSSRLKLTGQQEMDALISVFNAMLTSLREERLNAEEQRQLLASIVERTPTGIVIFDFDNSVSMMNPSATALFKTIQSKNSSSALIGTSINELPEPFATSLKKLGSTGNFSQHKHISEIVSIGARRVRCARIEFYDRGFTRAVYLLDELTEELRRSEKAAYDKLIRVFAHEINNSMGAVRSILQSLRLYTRQINDEDRTDAESAIDVAVERTSSLAEFVKNYAEIIRLPAPNLVPCDIVQILHHVSILLTPLAEEKKCSWEWRSKNSLEELPILVLADKIQIQQALLNIIKNAIEASHPKTSIILSCEKNYRECIVSIENVGTQISAEAQAHLFTPFFTTKPQGQGIGLMIVREILTAHNTHFILENTSTGARFTFTLQNVE